MVVSKKTMKKPDETKKFPNMMLEIVKVGEFTIRRHTYRPGWKWSKHSKPIAKTNSCQTHHVGFCISGRIEGVMDDGTKWEMRKGDVIDLPAGHDGWVVGRKPFVFVEFMGPPQ